MAIQERSLKSSAIQHIIFDLETQELWIVFNKRRVYPTYHYEGVPQDVIVGFLNAPSAGQYFHSQIDGNYQSSALHGPTVNNRVQGKLDHLGQIDIQGSKRWR